MIELQGRASNKLTEEIQLLVDAAVASKRTSTMEICKAHLKASIGRVDGVAQIQRRFALGIGDSMNPQDTGDDTFPSEPGSVDLEVAVAADSLQHPTNIDPAG
jgi:hypothetical protein